MSQVLVLATIYLLIYQTWQNLISKLTFGIILSDFRMLFPFYSTTISYLLEGNTHSPCSSFCSRRFPLGVILICIHCSLGYHFERCMYSVLTFIQPRKQNRKTH